MLSYVRLSSFSFSPISKGMGRYYRSRHLSALGAPPRLSLKPDEPRRCHVQQRRTLAATPHYDIKKVGVVGLGLMGHGIGLVSAQAGYEVIAVEAQAPALESGKKRIDKSLSKILSKAVEKGKMTLEAAEKEKEKVERRITYSLDLAALRDADLVVEAIVENLGKERRNMSRAGRADATYSN